jgi:hypothetical protein
MHAILEGVSAAVPGSSVAWNTSEVMTIRYIPVVSHREEQRDGDKSQRHGNYREKDGF